MGRLTAEQKWDAYDAVQRIGGKAKDSALTFAAFVAALLAWYDAQQDVERNAASNYDLTKYRPRPKAF